MASAWPKGLRTRHVYRAWSLRTGRTRRSSGPSAWIRSGSTPSESAVCRTCPSRLQLSSPLPGLHPTQRSRSSAAPSSVSGVWGCTDSWGRGSGGENGVRSSQEAGPQPPSSIPENLDPSRCLLFTPTSLGSIIVPLNLCGQSPLLTASPPPSDWGPDGPQPSPSDPGDRVPLLVFIPLPAFLVLLVCPGAASCWKEASTGQVSGLPRGFQATGAVVYLPYTPTMNS